MKFSGLCVTSDAAGVILFWFPPFPGKSSCPAGEYPLANLTGDFPGHLVRKCAGSPETTRACGWEGSGSVAC